MEASVDKSGLEESLATFGDIAFLVSVNDDASPHVVAVRPIVSDGLLVVGTGSRSRMNAAERPNVTVLWPAPPGEGYCLIVDGEVVSSPPRPPASTGSQVPAGPTAHRHGDVPGRESAEVKDGTLITLQPVAAVLHRTPEGDPEAPSCIKVFLEKVR